MSSSKGSSSSPSPLSPAVIEGNDDLLIELLLFLPAKSLVSFKTVSKRWRSLISDDLFCRRHTLHHPLRRRETQTLLLIGTYGSKYIVCDPTIPRLHPSQLQFGLPSVEVMQSCNGLLLLQSHEEGKGWCYYVFNPTTMQKRELPPLPNDKYFAGIFLMFDPYISPHYRVVYFEYAEKGKNLVYLYKSEDREWNKLVGEAIEMDVSCHPGFYFNGGICFDSVGCLSIFTPDDCKHTKFPGTPGRGQPRRRVMECNGVVFCLTLSWREGVVLLTVWKMEMEIMEKERRGWKKKYEVDMNPIIAKCDDWSIYFLGMVRADEKEEEDYVLMFRLPGKKMMIYRFFHGVFEDCDDWCVGVAHHFIRTLAPV